MGTILAFDFGEKRIGVAVGETLLGQAHPLLVIRSEANDQRFGAIEKLLQEWQPERLVVGRPTHLDGTPHAMTARAHRFANQLRGRFGLPVSETDERLTSVNAEAILRQTGHNTKSMKPLLDAVAAQLILQTWFDTPHADEHPERST